MSAGQKIFKYKKLYKYLGGFVCKIILLGCIFRDAVRPPKEDSVVFVAHPDDDTLFFHSYLRTEKPYVVLLFTGWSLRRLFGFFKTMRYYGLRCRAYATVSSRAYFDETRRIITEENIKNSLKIGHFQTIVTHNAQGEYGHATHRLVHEAVLKVCAGSGQNILCPTTADTIEKYPLSQEALLEKQFIFDHFYRSERWVMTDEITGTAVWFSHERLEPLENTDI